MTRLLSIAILLAALASGAAFAQTYEDGLKALNDGDADTASEVWLPLARNGDARAQYAVGRLYFSGEGVAQHYQKALYWFEKAADTGHADAHFYIGLMHERGLGVQQNLLAAAEWYKKAIQWGNVTDAYYRLGRLYLHGLGTPDNIANAFEYMQAAAHKGHRLAQFHMGAIHEQGWGVEQDYIESFKWYALASNAGDVLLDGAEEYNVGKALGNLEARMTPLQLAVAERRINRWRESQPR
ncbi:MAG: tetratricopeptide repeat protein [Acetobacterales bacterium]